VAQELSNRGASVGFVTHGEQAMARRITAAGFQHVDLGRLPGHLESQPQQSWSGEQQSIDACRTIEAIGDTCTALVVDHYGLDARWEQRVHALTSKLVAIDDLANRPHSVDIVTDQNWYGPHTNARYHQLVDSDCVTLLGPRYAILQSDYRRARMTRSAANWPPQSILVQFGGTDPHGETEKVLAALSDGAFSAIDVKVVVGATERVNPRIQELVTARSKTSLHVAVPSVAPFLIDADLAIGASGAATWERLCLGVPAIVATTAPHQSGVTKALAEANLTWWVGLTNTTTPAKYGEQLAHACISERPFLPSVVDGFGAVRLAEAILPTPACELDIRPATTADIASIVGLDGENGSEVPGLLDGPEAWIAETRSMLAWLASSAVTVLVVELAGLPIGYARVSENNLHVATTELVRGRDLTIRVSEKIAAADVLAGKSGPAED
jgi:UDP-2,4-diacetamido-2,4,6-trideoxy-beta-L-altropyranose hydrolase